MAHFRCLLVRALVLAGLALVVGEAAAFQQPAVPLRFDAGPTGSASEAEAVLLTPDDLYDFGRGYGWTKAPEGSFVRPELDSTRTSFTRDGVSGASLGFRADIPNGVWWITAWLEAGLEDSSTIAIRLNGEPRHREWQAFLPSAEGRTALQKVYRIFHGRTEVSGRQLHLEIDDDRDSVRLLGFTLHLDPVPRHRAHHDILERIGSIGRYPAAAPLDSLGTGLGDLLAELERILALDPADAFASYWREQVELLARAEAYVEMMGWEWATDQTRLGIFDRYHGAVMILDGLLDRPAPFPLYERALWQRTRILYWLGRERGGPGEIAAAKRDLAILRARYPDDPLLSMYAGERIELPDPCDGLEPVADAPAWAESVRETLCRLRRIAHWWVEERQIANGELGGKLGDDVELLRWWAPLILSGDTTTFRGWKRLADGIWESDQIHLGYARRVSDVEHASEFISDTAPPMVLFTDDPEYRDRLRYSAEHFARLWTGRTAYGRRYFRSAWFSATEVDTLEPRNRDLEMNTRAVKAVRYLAWRTGDPDVISLLNEWSSAWVHAALRTDKGKPRGIIPASIRFPDEAINGDEATWYAPHMFWDYFDWEHSVGSKMLDQLLFTYTLTGDEALLQPLIAALELVKANERAVEVSNEAAAGSPAWAASLLREESSFWSVVEQWRLFTANPRYDDLILRYGTPYARYRLTGDERYLVEGLDPVLETVRYNTPLLTSEVLHTDRVYVAPRNVPGANHLHAMLTGDGMPENMSPYPAVSWEDTNDDFAAVVTDSGPDHLRVRLFSFTDAARTIQARLWQLRDGRYRLTHQPQGREPAVSELSVETRGQRVRIMLPARTVLDLVLERIP